MKTNTRAFTVMLCAAIFALVLASPALAGPKCSGADDARCKTVKCETIEECKAICGTECEVVVGTSCCAEGNAHTIRATAEPIAITVTPAVAVGNQVQVLTVDAKSGSCCGTKDISQCTPAEIERCKEQAASCQTNSTQCSSHASADCCKGDASKCQHKGDAKCCKAGDASKASACSHTCSKEKGCKSI